MIYWAPLFHFYQPPTQVSSVLRRICDESYRPLIRLFREHPGARATINVNGSLTELLVEQGGEDVIAGLRELAERRQIELVGSGKYHPILPLIPPEEIRRQISLNYQTNRAYFGESYAPQGFFPPELCYSRTIVDPIAEAGFRWVILSGIACPTDWPLDVTHRIESVLGDMHVFFRDDLLSNDISFRTVDAQGFLERLRALAGSRPKIYVVTAMDAETFGHHLRGWDRDFLEKVYAALEAEAAVEEEAPVTADQPAVGAGSRAALALAPQRPIRVAMIGELLDLFPNGQSLDPRPSSWSTTAGDLAKGVAYPLWRQPGNVIHDLQWQLLGLCVELVGTAQGVADNDLSRRHAQLARILLDRALHSCQFWWASRRPMWDINMVNRGVLQEHEVVLNAHKAISSSGASADVKTRSYHKVVVARELASRIGDHLFAD